MSWNTHVFPNGLRLIHQEVNRAIGHCGLVINAGSRDELEQEQGLAHFIEHTLFKGTKKRKAYHILSRMEDVGGEINAYTSKEETSLYASFLAPYYGRAIELLFDIAFQSTFPAKEIKKERDVIVDEINSYRDNPVESIFDDFEEVLFNGHPLGRNILGTKESVQSFGRTDILRFIGRNYNLHGMVLSSVGPISFKKLVKLVERYTAGFTSAAWDRPRELVNGYHPQVVEVKRDGYQTHAIVGNRAYPARHEKVTAMLLLNNLLGGPGMNNRLNLNIRERYGFTYNLESFYQPYTDTGVFGVYLGTDPGTVDRTLGLVQRELKKLRDVPLGTLQLTKAKRQLLGQVAMSQENNASNMLGLGKSYLLFDHIDTLEEMTAKIEAVTPAQLLDVANEVFDPAQQTTLIYKVN